MMIRKPIELPPAVALAFVEDMKPSSPTAIASRLCRLRTPFRMPLGLRSADS
jgi:hypothetical protein